MPVYNLVPLFRKKQGVCKKRSFKSCKSSKKKCLWASGSKRSFCRKRATRRRRS